MIKIRTAQLDDLEAVTDIYNEAIVTTTATFDTEPRTREQQLAWFHSHDARHPILVGLWDDVIAGWASLSTWSERPAYNDTAETSFYVRESYRGRGIGKELKRAIIETARRLGYHTLIAGVAEESLASFHINESFGFEHVGTLKEVGRKFGKLLDVHLFQLMLK